MRKLSKTQATTQAAADTCWRLFGGSHDYPICCIAQFEIVHPIWACTPNLSLYSQFEPVLQFEPVHPIWACTPNLSLYIKFEPVQLSQHFLVLASKTCQNVYVRVGK